MLTMHVIVHVQACTIECATALDVEAGIECLEGTSAYIRFQRPNTKIFTHELAFKDYTGYQVE